MLGVAWAWNDARRNEYLQLERRLAASLCAGIGGYAGTADIAGVHFAYRGLRSTAAAARAWRPACLPSGAIVVFHGYFDNLATIADQLSCKLTDAATVYGDAVERWGDDADLRIVGDYCSVYLEPANFRARLARSPLRAPPLQYFIDAEFAAIASVPRALFAVGVKQEIDEEHLADSALANLADGEASWFRNVFRVPLGSVVEFGRDRPRVLRKFYDPLLLPEVRLSNDAEYIERARELLDEAVRVCTVGFRKPSVALSGGLDSPQVAIRALSALPLNERLPTYTFHPEPGYDGLVNRGMVGDERPAVEGFAALHPRLEPHFTANEGYEFDHRWNELFHLMGGAPNALCNMYVYHGLLDLAVKNSRDLLLVADWGNHAFSEAGASAFVEYLFKGRWRQLLLALRALDHNRRRLVWRVFAQCIAPLLPNGLWRALNRVIFPKRLSFVEQIQPLSASFRRSSGADERLNRSGIILGRYQPWNRRQTRMMPSQNEGEFGEIIQAFEQMYGVAIRDPMAYRPLVEFCWGLPTRMFVRDGVRRWLAKELAKDIMPLEQRENKLNGRWDADWHLRIGRRRDGLLKELADIEADERIGPMLDIPKMRAALQQWPSRTEVDPQKYLRVEMGVPRALLTARFVKYCEGRNR
jgi:asparagine synthase (glutamine-hydrolysing)